MTGGALLGTAAVIIWNDVADAGRTQFYDWHDKEHMAERLAIPGFRRGRRYASAHHSPEWLTLYEADGLDVVTSAAYLQRLNAPTPSTRAALAHFRNTSRAVCRLVSSAGSSSGGHALAMRLDGRVMQSDALYRRIGSDVFSGLAMLTGVVACHLYEADYAASHVDTAESRTREFDVPACVLMIECTTVDAGHRARRTIDAADLQRFGVVPRSDAAVYSLEISRLGSLADVPPASNRQS